IPRAFSSGALSIWSYAMNWPPCVSAITFVSAAVSVVFPWSTCPIVPTFTCGLLRSNFSFDMARILQKKSGNDLELMLNNRVGDIRRHFDVLGKFHRERRAALAHRAHGRRVAEHLGERYVAGDDLAGCGFFHPGDLTPAAIQVADHIARVLLGGDHLNLH